jgi:hypothetical protein
MLVLKKCVEVQQKIRQAVFNYLSLGTKVRDLMGAPATHPEKNILLGFRQPRTHVDFTL